MRVLIKSSKDSGKGATGTFYGFAKTNGKIVAVVRYTGYDLRLDLVNPSRLEYLPESFHVLADKQNDPKEEEDKGEEAQPKRHNLNGRGLFVFLDNLVFKGVHTFDRVWLVNKAENIGIPLISTCWILNAWVAKGYIKHDHNDSFTIVNWPPKFYEEAQPEKGKGCCKEESFFSKEVSIADTKVGIKENDEKISPDLAQIAEKVCTIIFTILRRLNGVNVPCPFNIDWLWSQLTCAKDAPCSGMQVSVKEVERACDLLISLGFLVEIFSSSTKVKQYKTVKARDAELATEPESKEELANQREATINGMCAVAKDYLTDHKVRCEFVALWLWGNAFCGRRPLGSQWLDIVPACERLVHYGFLDKARTDSSYIVHTPTTAEELLKQCSLLKPTGWFFTKKWLLDQAQNYPEVTSRKVLDLLRRWVKAGYLEETNSGTDTGYTPKVNLNTIIPLL